MVVRHFHVNTVSMVRRNVSSQKKRGPPATGKGTLIGVRLQPAPLLRLDQWSRAQDDKPSRPEAIRRLLEVALFGTQPIRRQSPKGASKASEMAARQIDQLVDSSATDEERQQRKRRLLKGPKEFRDMRGDLPKPKG